MTIAGGINYEIYNEQIFKIYTQINFLLLIVFYKLPICKVELQL